MRLIDADALKSIEQIGKVFEYECNELYGMLELIDNQPTANEWIPCSERLPEEFNDEYLVTFNNGVVSSLIYTDDKQWADIQYCHYTNMVMAWRPLPKPYEVQNESR